ncbi:hypothetical protein [Futiania mangrovi]|uniref:Uncharacterized protein n=1 Tax=Futiania mangrovi TaxID=2959716 RepID=A0A9J6PBJ6_9PROT|nr:hypothetical protein [Futiania mangrovii]MCP1335550.1 hypothetical protein [Futiania mangrovii]
MSEGFDDRLYGGIQANTYLGKLGLHGEVAGALREEDAAYGAAGLSYALTPEIRAKAMVGTSTSNDSIYPQFLAHGSLEITAATGLVLRPAVTYRDYRNDVEETTVGADLTKYFSPFADGGYLVGQVKGNVSFVSPGSNTGWETGAALTYVTRDGHSAGAEVFGGTMAYDNTVGLSSVSIENDFFGVRPKVGYRLSDATELFVQGEFIDTDAYDVIGGLAGIKVTY